MAYLDENLKFLEATAVNASTGTALVGDVIDLGTGARNPFRGEQMFLQIVVTAAFTSGTSSTVQFVLASDATATIATDGSATEHAWSQVYTDAELTANKVIQIPISSANNAERYLGLLVVTGGAATTAGSITAELTAFALADWDAHPDAVN